MAKIVIINGNGRVGKDKFIELCNVVSEENEGPYIFNISTVDFVKSIAHACGWDGTKTEKNRKFLSDLKDLLSEWGDVPNKKIDEYIRSHEKYYPNCIIFIHAREPENIEYYKNKYNATTILVVNGRVEQITTNHADMEVYDFAYDYLIDNNGDLEQLKESAETFIKAISNEIRSVLMKYKDKYKDAKPMSYVENGLLVSTKSKGCMMCGEFTNFIEVCSESYFCSKECCDAFYDSMMQNEEET